MRSKWCHITTEDQGRKLQKPQNENQIFNIISVIVTYKNTETLLFLTKYK